MGQGDKVTADDARERFSLIPFSAVVRHTRERGNRFTFLPLHLYAPDASGCTSRRNSGLTLSPFYLRTITARHVRFTPESGHSRAWICSGGEGGENALRD